MKNNKYLESFKNIVAWTISIATTVCFFQIAISELQTKGSVILLITLIVFTFNFSKTFNIPRVIYELMMFILEVINLIPVFFEYLKLTITSPLSLLKKQIRKQEKELKKLDKQITKLHIAFIELQQSDEKVDYYEIRKIETFLEQSKNFRDLHREHLDSLKERLQIYNQNQNK